MTEAEHMPDMQRIPEPLQDLDWQILDDGREWLDGEQLLVAVPVCRNSNHPSQGWFYEISVIDVHCDEGLFSLTVNQGDDWGWDQSNIDFIVRIRR